MKKALKYAAVILTILIVAFNSVYFKKLDQVKASKSGFDAKAFAKNYFHNKLTPALNNAIDINQLLSLLQNNKEHAFNQYSHALGIGNIKYFLVSGEGVIISVNENDVTLLSKKDSMQQRLRVATEFVFGNALRDASGLVNVNEFTNTMDFNNVSAEINKIVRSEVLPPFKARAKQGDTVEFVGAIELNKEHLNVKDIEIIPVQLKIK